MRIRVRLEQHVALVDAGPAANRRTVNAETFFERRLRQLLDGIGNVMPQPGNVGEAQIENLRVVLPRELENSLLGIGISHENSLPGSDSLQRSGERLRRILQQRAGCYNRSRCAEPRESKASRGRWQFDCFYSGDNGTLYWSYQLSALSTEDTEDADED